MPIQPRGEVERREQALSSDRNQKPVMPPHTAAEVQASEYMDREKIAELAYRYWLAREGRAAGSPEDDWLRAEQELRSHSRRAGLSGLPHVSTAR